MFAPPASVGARDRASETPLASACPRNRCRPLRPLWSHCWAGTLSSTLACSLPPVQLSASRSVARMPSRSYREARNAAQARPRDTAAALTGSLGAGTGSTAYQRPSLGMSRSTLRSYDPGDDDDDEDDDPEPYHPMTPSDYVRDAYRTLRYASMLMTLPTHRRTKTRTATAMIYATGRSMPSPVVNPTSTTSRSPRGSRPIL